MNSFTFLLTKLILILLRGSEPGIKVPGRELITKGLNLALFLRDPTNSFSGPPPNGRKESVDRELVVDAGNVSNPYQLYKELRERNKEGLINKRYQSFSLQFLDS